MQSVIFIVCTAANGFWQAVRAPHTFSRRLSQKEDKKLVDIPHCEQKTSSSNR
jgi:tRNA A37 threonylcarbamoyltransferase TsaD